MREKLQKLMASEQLTASRFAELLGIQPSGVTHLLGGRNKPSFDLVQKILRRFPHINPDWLLLDSEQMYRADAELTNDQPNQTSNEVAETPVNVENISAAENTTISEGSTSANNSIERLATIGAVNRKNVKRVIVLFDDHTFESFEMSK
ncbi:MAG: helix-turn-helix transcriptional regulator [Alistipes sp.]|nr:helix-turn-helix transcriptional regulator [Alistipes sp.]MBR6672902.1 helix-turn-helix transcriptional regulator [Alistipes sp.]